MLRSLTTTLFLAALGTVAVATPASAVGTVRGADAPGAIPGQFIVVLKDSAQSVPSQATALANRFGGTVRTSYRTAVRGFSARLTAAAAQRLAADPSVSYVEQDRLVSASGSPSPSTKICTRAPKSWSGETSSSKPSTSDPSPRRAAACGTPANAGPTTSA